MSKILIDEEEYRSLLESEMELAALNDAGVDNWAHWAQAFDDFVQFHWMLDKYAEENDVDPAFVLYDDFKDWIVDRRMRQAKAYTKHIYSEFSNKLIERIKEIIHE